MIPPHKEGEKSFTLIETLIALGIMVTLVLQIAIVQGQAISFSDYGRNMTKGMWLARSLMSQIEYQSKFLTLKDMKYDQSEQEFKENLCPKDEDGEPCPFRYTLKIQNWKLDLVDIFFRSKPKQEGEEGGDDNPMIDMIKEHLKDQIGEELISYAHVEVFWSEGSRRNSVDLALLLTDQIGLDGLIQTLPPLEGADSSPPPPPPGSSDGSGVFDPNVPGQGGSDGDGEI